MIIRTLSLSSAREMWDLLKETAAQWSRDKIPRHGAALAYYTVFSIVPLLIIIIAMIGLVFGQEAAQSYILQELENLLGQQSTAAIKDMLQRASQPATGIVASVTALATLLIGASGLFGQLQDSLNSIWEVEPTTQGVWAIIRDRFLSFLAVFGTGFLLLVSLVLSAGLAALGRVFEGWLPAPEFILHLMNALLSFVVITALFAMMFKVLPDAQVAWRDVWVGAAITALLFTIGKFSIGLYLGKSDVGSAYGAAGSLVILLIWVYYSTQILLFGAEFTKVYARRAGARIVPSKDAVTVDSEKASGESAARNAGTPAEPGASLPGPTSSPGHAAIWPSRPQGSATAVPRREQFGWLEGGLFVWALVQIFRKTRLTEPR